MRHSTVENLVYVYNCITEKFNRKSGLSHRVVYAIIGQNFMILKGNSTLSYNLKCQISCHNIVIPCNAFFFAVISMQSISKL